MSETILTAENLKFRYDAEQPVYALDGVSAQVKRGEFVAVLGANGCGKSTLAKHFNAILLPESGKVYVEGMDTADEEKLYDIRQTVGMVFQNPDNQIVATVVEEDVAFALENLGVPQDEMRRRVDDSMKMAGIYEYRERAPHNLSGGQKQRVAIAGVVAMRPDCLILDEATAMLDPRGREQVMQTIHYLNRNMGITVVSITHYMEEAAQADRVLVMSKGHVVMEGTPKEVFSQTAQVGIVHLVSLFKGQIKRIAVHRLGNLVLVKRIVSCQPTFNTPFDNRSYPVEIARNAVLGADLLVFLLLHVLVEQRVLSGKIMFLLQPVLELPQIIGGNRVNTQLKASAMQYFMLETLVTAYFVYIAKMVLVAVICQIIFCDIPADLVDEMVFFGFVAAPCVDVGMVVFLYQPF